VDLKDDLLTKLQQEIATKENQFKVWLFLSDSLYQMKLLSIPIITNLYRWI